MSERKRPRRSDRSKTNQNVTEQSSSDSGNFKSSKAEIRKRGRERLPDPTAAPVLSHISWIIAIYAVTLAITIWVGVTTYQPATLWPFKDLNYSATVVLGMCLLGGTLIFLHAVLQAYQGHTTKDGRFPGEILTKEIPPSISWLRSVIFVLIVILPTVAYIALFPRMFGLSIVHNDGKQADRDTKTGSALATDWGTTFRSSGRKIVHDWHWDSEQDHLPSYQTSTNRHGIDAWPGLFASVHIGLACIFVISIIVLLFRPLNLKTDLVSS